MIPVMREPLTHVKTFDGLFADRLRRDSIGVWSVRPSRLSCKGSRLAALFACHPSGSRPAAHLPSPPPQFGHDAGNLGWTRTVLFHRWISEHSDLVVGKLVKVGFRVTWAFRRHTPLLWHGCVSGSIVQNFKVAHYRSVCLRGRRCRKVCAILRNNAAVCGTGRLIPAHFPARRLGPLRSLSGAALIYVSQRRGSTGRAEYRVGWRVRIPPSGTRQ